MPRLSNSQRIRLTEYKDNRLYNGKHRFRILHQLAANEKIIISIKSIIKIIKIWTKTVCMHKLESQTRKINKTKITTQQMEKIDKLITRKRELTSLQIRNKLRLTVAPRSIRRYINILGWKKMRTR
jgi:midasin (ATPase involved in ribosome maturation)